MSGNRYLLDSNVIICISKGDAELVRIIDTATNYFAVSVITYMEVLGYNFQNQCELEMVQEIFNLMDLLYLDEAVADRAIDIRKIKKIKLPDAIIAATALELELTLITANYHDFKNLPQLKLLNK